jgi:peroxiredoxin
MPDIVQTWRDYKDRGFNVIGINYDEGEKDARDFAQAYGMEFPTFFDPGKKVAGQYGVISMPSSYLINRQGEVEVFIPGKIDFSQLRPAIEQLLLEPQ